MSGTKRPGRGAPAGAGGRGAPVDEEARRRAVADLDVSFCVEAGAGTGKTSLLVDRFLAVIESGRAVCGEIVAITFTEKAAGEMKTRLRQRIDRRRRDESLAAAARANLERAYDELERSPISTIHSFAATILREHPIEARIDPNFTQLDALEGALFFDECWSDFLSRGAESWSETLRRFVMFVGPVGRHEDRLRDMAEMIYAHRGQRLCDGMFDGGIPTDDGALLEPAATDPADELRAAFATAAERLAALERDHCVNPDDLGARAAREFVGAMEALEILRGDDLSSFLLTVKLPKNKGNKANWRPAETCAEQKEIFTALAALQDDERTRISDFLRGDLERFFDAFLAFADERKAALGVLDFDDLLIKARALCRVESALDDLRARYRYILVDEFQDTDSVQAEIVYLLAGAAGVRGAADPVAGKLFIVGDPKQSIYRFRKADVEVYERVKERLGGSGERLSIVENFRSVPGIVEWVNETFSDIMRPPGEGRFQPRYEAIHPYRSGGGPPVVLLDLELAGEKAAAETVRRREGEAIARLIRQMIDERVGVRDPKTGDERPVRHGDIAVIYPGTTGIDNYEDPLRDEDIPYIVEGGKLYYSREEIKALAAAVWAIEDPYDALALVAALRSPIFGASDEEVFLFTRRGGRLDYLAQGDEEAGAETGIGASFDLLAALHARRNELGPSGTILELLRATKFLELSLLRPHGEQRVSNIRKAVSSARAFEEKSHSYRRFARWFRDQEALASAEGESPIVEGDEQAVRLLTVHKAKGLQFPVVILANLVQGRRFMSSIIVSGGSHLSFKLGLLETSDHPSRAEEERARETAETVRLLYVAATRAGDMLVVPHVPTGGNYFDYFKGHLLADRNGGDRSGVEGGAPRSAHVRDLALSVLPSLRGKRQPFVRLEEPSGGAREKASRDRLAWLAERARLIEGARKAPLVLAPSKVSSEALAPAPTDAFAPEAVGARLAEERSSRDRTLLFGQAFHRIMELADLSRTIPAGGCARAVAAELGISDEAPELERLAAETLESELIARAAKAPRCLREAPFTLAIGDSFLEGRIDLLFEEDGRWTLVDYKTDLVGPGLIGERLAAYRPQASVYAYALEKLGVPCAGGVVLYFVRPNIVVPVGLSRELLVEAEGLIRAALAGRSGARADRS